MKAAGGPDARALPIRLDEGVLWLIQEFCFIRLYTIVNIMYTHMYSMLYTYGNS